jgi:hypothetical protein
MVISIRDLIDMIMHGDLILQSTNFCTQLSSFDLPRIRILLIVANSHAYPITMGICKVIEITFSTDLEKYLI